MEKFFVVIITLVLSSCQLIVDFDESEIETNTFRCEVDNECIGEFGSSSACGDMCIDEGGFGYTCGDTCVSFCSKYDFSETEPNNNQDEAYTLRCLDDYNTTSDYCRENRYIVKTDLGDMTLCPGDKDVFELYVLYHETISMMFSTKSWTGYPAQAIQVKIISEDGGEQQIYSGTDGVIDYKVQGYGFYYIEVTTLTPNTTTAYHLARIIMLPVAK